MQEWPHRKAFIPFPFFVAHLLVKAWLCFPNLLQPLFCFGFPFGQTATGLLGDLGLPRLCYLGPRKNSSLCYFTLPFAESLSPWRNHIGLRRRCHNHSGTLLLASVPYISPPANLLLPLSGELSPFLTGLSAFISPGNDFLSLSTKAQEERPFIHNWPQCGVGVNVLQSWHKCIFQQNPAAAVSGTGRRLTLFGMINDGITKKSVRQAVT